MCVKPWNGHSCFWYELFTITSTVLICQVTNVNIHLGPVTIAFYKHSCNIMLYIHLHLLFDNLNWWLVTDAAAVKIWDWLAVHVHSCCYNAVMFDFTAWMLKSVHQFSACMTNKHANLALLHASHPNMSTFGCGYCCQLHEKWWISGIHFRIMWWTVHIIKCTIAYAYSLAWYIIMIPINRIKWYRSVM